MNAVEVKCKSLDNKKAAAKFLAKLTKGLLEGGAVEFDGKDEKVLIASINTIIESYKNKGFESENNQVIVQLMVENMI